MSKLSLFALLLNYLDVPKQMDFSTVSIIGWIYILFTIYRLMLTVYNLVYPFFLAEPRDLREIAGAKWAVITGATDGIGKGYAFELARKGFSILLVSRTQSRLDDVKAQIEKETSSEVMQFLNTKVRTIVFDFSSADIDYYEHSLLSQIRALDVGILVNSVGSTFEYPDLYHKVDGGVKLFRHITVINIIPVTLLMAAVLPQMYERNSGIIVNVASSSAYYKLRWFSVYAASKVVFHVVFLLEGIIIITAINKYISWLTKIVQKEYAKTNIIIQEVNPMIVVTKLAKVKRPSFFRPKADVYARSAVRTIGIIKHTTGYFAHQIKVECLKWLPEFIADAQIHKRMILFHKVMVARKMRQAAINEPTDAKNVSAQNKIISD
uniref:Oxidoreductase n=1 Tax=Wuchereria bancrofti TaxID=6293 RepID=A0A1I8EAV2_WUCBA